MPHPVFDVPCAGEGRLGMMACPPSLALSETLDDLVALGVTDLLSMLTEQEMQALGVTSEPAGCRAAGIRFHSFPITDFGLPPVAAFAALVADLCALIGQGHHVVVHCRAGIGRSGMVAAAILIGQGTAAREALAIVSKARGVSVPDTVEQADFVTFLDQGGKLGAL